MHILNWPRVLSASIESLQIVIAVLGLFSVIFLIMSSPVAITHNFASIIFLFMPRKILIFFQLSSRFLSFKHIAANTFSWLSLNLSIHNIYLLVFFRFLHSFFFLFYNNITKTSIGIKALYWFYPICRIYGVFTSYLLS